MNNMNPPVTLSTAPLEHPAMDYAYLRSEGMRLLERLAGKVWTDFNAHDPGITILEQLCYAITDLGYRINYDIQDLLAGDDEPYRWLYSPAKVLASKPVTLLDLRKLVIDIVGVKNAWIEAVTNLDPGLVFDPSEVALYLDSGAPQPPHRQPLVLRGLYRVLIEIDDSVGRYPADILPEVNRRLHSCRSLCEDFLPPVIMKAQGIIVQANIEIGKVDDPEWLLAQIYVTLAEAISPTIHFYTLQQMLDQGKSIDQIFDGPALKHGFIDDNELAQLQSKAGLRTSDLLHSIMSVSGVLSVGEMKMGMVIGDAPDKLDNSGNAMGAQSEEWYLKLPPDSTPKLDIDKSLFASNGPTISLTKGGIKMPLDASRVKEFIQRMQQSAAEIALPPSELDIVLKAGQDLQAGQYTSFQHQFPALYGIGAMGLPASSSPERRAQSQQLKAYLMFFDQLLANYFAQLGHAKELFSFDASASGSYQTYFSQSILQPELGLDELLIGKSEDYASMLQNLTESVSSDARAERKNRFLNHLLARFAEQFTDYSLLQYKHLEDDDLIADKCAFLQNYETIGLARGCGFDTSLPVWNSDNVSGLEKRISLKLGLSSYRWQDLASLSAENEGGFHALEHILLRPRITDKERYTQNSGMSWQSAFMAQPVSKDPYSHQISFIFPSWIDGFKRTGFAELLAKTLREETPAHLHIRLVWFDQDEMLAFETAYKLWHNSSMQGGWSSALGSSTDNQQVALALRDARDQMVQLLEIGIAYPLRDIQLRYDTVVAYNHPGSIKLLGAQIGVRYQLCDEDGNAIIVNGKTFEVTPKAKAGAAPTIVLSTPAIVKDITYTILASRATTNKQAPLESYLQQTISIQTGIDTALPVSFQISGTQTMREAQLVCNYGDLVTVIIGKTQEGISYKLVDKVSDGVNLSNPVKGNKGEIALISKAGFLEDSIIYVQAYRTSNPDLKAQLDSSVAILVRPNPALMVSLDQTIINYQTATNLNILQAQDSVEYRLYRKQLSLSDYLPDATPGALLVATAEGRNIAIKMPATFSDWSKPGAFTEVGVFVRDGDKLRISTGNLKEDCVFIIAATKIVNREQLQLKQALAILVRPNTASPVSTPNAQVRAGSAAMVVVDGTQKGVAYQLRLDADNLALNPLGYHVSDRGIGSMRIDVDLLVGESGAASLLLPTGNITKSTRFNVLAIKTITGVSAQLTNKVTLDVTP